MECFVLLCHVGEGPVPTALVYDYMIYVEANHGDTLALP